MIIINVEVPVLDKKYDVRVNETVQLVKIRNELIDLICREEQCQVEGDRNRFLFYDVNSHRMLDLSLSAYENNLKTGQSVILA
ncbi:MAG: hypothetical protein Q4C20_01530 [Erysipelotrichaceae bacterium]|nr:hypothetical protein [Erysipelotrichaceae bacterium]